MKNITVTVIRHPKERLSKCSLQPLKDRKDIKFFTAKKSFHFDATSYIVLGLNAPCLSKKDVGHDLLILDSTWRLLPLLEACLTGEPIIRSLPKSIKTAYPRISKISEDPLCGLASVEALYAAKRILGEDDPALLDGYYWKDQFLAQFKK